VPTLTVWPPYVVYGQSICSRPTEIGIAALFERSQMLKLYAVLAALLAGMATICMVPVARTIFCEVDPPCGPLRSIEYVMDVFAPAQQLLSSQPDATVPVMLGTLPPQRFAAAPAGSAPPDSKPGLLRSSAAWPEPASRMTARAARQRAKDFKMGSPMGRTSRCGRGEDEGRGSADTRRCGQRYGTSATVR